MLEVALTVVSVVCALSMVGAVWVLAKAQKEILSHLKDTAQIGGTPVGLASKQTEWEMRKADEAQKQHEKIVNDLQKMKSGDSNSLEVMS